MVMMVYVWGLSVVAELIICLLVMIMEWIVWLDTLSKSQINVKNVNYMNFVLVGAYKKEKERNNIVDDNIELQDLIDAPLMPPKKRFEVELVVKDIKRGKPSTMEINETAEKSICYKCGLPTYLYHGGHYEADGKVYCKRCYMKEKDKDKRSQSNMF